MVNPYHVHKNNSPSKNNRKDTRLIAALAKGGRSVENGLRQMTCCTLYAHHLKSVSIILLFYKHESSNHPNSGGLKLLTFIYGIAILI